MQENKDKKRQTSGMTKIGILWKVLMAILEWNIAAEFARRVIANKDDIVTLLCADFRQVNRPMPVFMLVGLVRLNIAQVAAILVKVGRWSHIGTHPRRIVVSLLRINNSRIVT